MECIQYNSNPIFNTNIEICGGECYDCGQLGTGGNFNSTDQKYRCKDCYEKLIDSANTIRGERSKIIFTALDVKCRDCNGTGIYTGLHHTEPCRSCQT